MTDSDKYNTSIAGWSFALSRALADYGIDSHRVFLDAGIDLSEVQSPAQRLPVSSVQQVWRYAMEHTDDDFGVVFAEHLTPASFHALGFALWSSTTLTQVLERLIRYRCVISHMFSCDLLEEDNHYRFVLVDQRSVKSRITNDAFFAYVARLCRLLGGSGFSPVLMSVPHSASTLSDRARLYFNTNIQADADEHSLLFDIEACEAKLPNGNEDLARQMDAVVERYIGELGLISEYMLRVKTEIYRLLSEGSVQLEQVAENLNVTVRTLQRRLSAENSSFNHLLDQVRHQLALEYLRQPRVSATEIAFRLGYNDSGSFGRSFKRWTGKSVSEYQS